MTTERVRLARRMVAIAAFREERERQVLAVTRRVAAAAQDVARAATEQVERLQSLRVHALVDQSDLHAWMRYAVLEDHADAIRDDAVVRASRAAVEETSATARWASAKGLLDASEDRADRIAGMHRARLEHRDAADRIDAWLVHEEMR